MTSKMPGLWQSVTYLLVVGCLAAGCAGDPGSSAVPATQIQLAACDAGNRGCLESIKLAESYRLAIRREQLFVRNEEAQLESFVSQRAHLVASLWSQLVVGWVLLVAVITICAAGIALSWQQLKHSWSRGGSTDAKVEFGKDGFEVESLVIGLIIFVVSTLFFYLYVANIYPITVLGSIDRPALPAVSSASSGTR